MRPVTLQPGVATRITRDQGGVEVRDPFPNQTVQVVETEHICTTGADGRFTLRGVGRI